MERPDERGHMERPKLFYNFHIINRIILLGLDGGGGGGGRISSRIFQLGGRVQLVSPARSFT